MLIDVWKFLNPELSQSYKEMEVGELVSYSIFGLIKTYRVNFLI